MMSIHYRQFNSDMEAYYDSHPERPDIRNGRVSLWGKVGGLQKLFGHETESSAKPTTTGQRAAEIE